MLTGELLISPLRHLIILKIARRFFQMNLPLDFFVSLLGPDVFFVPCAWGTKTPLVKYVERPFASTQSAAYRALFTGETNIAVYLGKASGGLCALDFDDDADLAAFFALNPKLTSTTHSRGSRGGMIWLRISGEYPASCNPEHKHFEWRADSRLSTISGRHPKGMDYTLLCDKPPITLSFSELVWPPDWTLPWVTAAATAALNELEAIYGRSVVTDDKGRVLGFSERFWAALFAKENRVLYDPESDAFWSYSASTGLWSLTSPESIRELISARMFAVARESDQLGLQSLITVKRLNPVVAALKGIVERRAAFRSRPALVHVSNGVLRFPVAGDVTFGAFSPDDFSRNRSPFEFKPGADCPRFLSELILSAISPDDASLLQRWAGLALFGYNLPQRFLILDGIAGGGKGTFVRIIQALVGFENCAQLRTNLLEERFEVAGYDGKTLLIGPDVAGDFLSTRGASMLKALVGGDPLSAEAKGGNQRFSLWGTFNVVVTCNTRLRVRLDGDSGAWRRRLLIVRYENKPPAKRIVDFDKVLLREEGPGILRWALAGFLALQSDLAATGDFALSEGQLARIDSLLSESDALRLFVSERIERGPGDLTSAEFVQAYSEFCADHGWNPLPVTLIERQSIDAMLEVWRVARSNSVQRDKRAVRGWRGVRLTNIVPLSASSPAYVPGADVDFDLPADSQET
jgi:P4 family phage/plasmid primase-like protien